MQLMLKFMPERREGRPPADVTAMFLESDAQQLHEFLEGHFGETFVINLSLDDLSEELIKFLEMHQANDIKIIIRGSGEDHKQYPRIFPDIFKAILKDSRVDFVND